MKKITKLLLIVLSFFLINVNVYAEGEEEETIQDDSYHVHQVSYMADSDGNEMWNNLGMAANAYDTSTMGNSLGITYAGSGDGVASVFKYMLTSNTTGESILGYCMSPDRTIPTQMKFSSETSLVGRRASMERMDAAYQAIISAGCHDKDCAYAEYVATSYALRAVTYLFSGGQAVDTSKSAKSFTCAIYNEALDWIENDAETISILKTLNPNYNAIPKGCNDADTLIINDEKGRAALERAKALLIEGINAAFDTLANDNTNQGDVKIKISPAVIDVSPENTTEKSSELKTYDVDVVITVEDIAAKTGQDGQLKNKVNITGIECESCAQYGITFSKIKYGSTGEVISEDKNLLEFLTAKDGYFNGNIILKASFTRSEDEECVPQIPFTVKYSYVLPDFKSEYNLGYLTESGDPGNNDTDKDQDFLAILSGPGYGDKTGEDTDVDMEDSEIIFNGDVTGIITCTEPDPEEEPPKCDEPTAFINPNCHEDGILEIYAPKNVKDCVLEKSDDTTNNKYELLGAKGGLSNKYCAVYCKEDYNEIYLQNTIDEVSCGSGFEIHARIDGTKMCYTAGKGTSGKSGNDKYQINIQQFASDIYNAQKDMIDAYNDYKYNKTGYDNIKEKKYTCCTCSGNTDCLGWKVENGNYTKYNIIQEYMYDDDKPKYKIKQLKIAAVQATNSEEGACKTSPCKTQTVPSVNPITGKIGYVTVCVAPGTCEPPSVTLAEKKAAFKSAYERALMKMQAAYQTYMESIAAINQCTKGWSNNYDFLKKVNVKYYYNEHWGEDKYYTPYYDIIRDNKDVDEIKLDLIDDPNYTYHTSEERFWLNDGVGGDGVDDYYKDGGTTNINNVLRDYVFAVCTQDKGCYLDEETGQQLPRAAFVRRNLNHVKSYQLPTQFYEIDSTYGKLKYSDTEIEDPYDGIALKNEVPITYNVCTGGEFDLIVENLGEYYDRAGEDETSYGRLVDCNAYDDSGMFKCDPDTQYVVSAYQEALGKDTFTGRYICDYNTDCDCSDQDTECDMSYAGKYYLVNQECGSVEIECCDIYATSYDRDTALGKNNKYICSLNETIYDTYLEAKNACTDHRTINGKYKCPDGTYSQFGECYRSTVDLVNSDSKACDPNYPDYHLKKVLNSEICVADPIEDLSYCDDGYRNIGNNECEKEYTVYSTNRLSDVEVGTIIGECTTADGQKIPYAELSKKYTCDAKVCDTSKGGVYKQYNKQTGKYDCIEMACCTDDVCIHEEDGKQSYYLKSKLATVKNIDNECPNNITSRCTADSKTINYYYTKGDKNVCVPACLEKDGTLRDTTGTAYDINLGLKTIASSGKTKEELCPSGDECLKKYGGMYAFEVNGKITCPTVDCCYDGDGDYKPCWNDSRTIIYNYYDLTKVDECPGLDTECKELYGGYYYYKDRPAGNYECFRIKCCTDDKDEDVCQTSDGKLKFKREVTAVTNYETQCQPKITYCDEEKGGLYKYKNTKTCLEIKCCDTGSGLCEAVAGNKVDMSSIVEVKNEVEECDSSEICLDEYGGRFAIPKCEGDCLECVDIKCCESNKPNAICHDAAGNTYNRSGLTFIGEEGSCEASCPDECGNECTPGDPDCPDPGCPNCRITCGPDGCTIVTAEDDCPLCDFKCFNCIFNNGSFNLTTKQISTTVMNDIAKNTSSSNQESGNQAANRQYGYNWITNSHLSELNVPAELKEKMARITDKATETITQIGEAGETIYGGEKDTNSSALNFSIEMTPGITDYLRNYNREHIEDGGYGNESLKCYHEMEDGEVKYQFIYCFSEVIDELTQKFSSKVTISNSRVTDEESRKANANSKNYWELWDENKVYSENAIGGPAWR